MAGQDQGEDLRVRRDSTEPTELSADGSHDSGIDSPHSSILEAEKSVAMTTGAETDEDEIDIVEM